MPGANGQMCRKKLISPIEAREHFRKVHQSEYRETIRFEEHQRGQRLDNLIDAIAANQGSEGTPNAAMMTVLLALAKQLGVPTGVEDAPEPAA